MTRITEKELVRALGVDEASDMGLQIVRDAAGKDFKAFVTAGVFKCAHCGVDVEFLSKIDKELVELTGDMVGARLESDRKTVADAREKHAAVCAKRPA